MKHMPQIWFALVTILFVWAAYLQLNDADPALWAAIYLIAAACSFAAAVRRPLPVVVPTALGVVTAGWALWLATIVFGGGEVRQMFPEEEGTGMVLVDSEEGREMGGLTIVAVALALVAVHTRRRASVERERDV